MEKAISYSEFGRMHGWTQPYISKLVKNKVIKKRSLLRVGQRLKIIPSLAEADLEKHRNRKRKKTGPRKKKKANIPRDGHRYKSLAAKNSRQQPTLKDAGIGHNESLPASAFMDPELKKLLTEPDPELEAFFSNTEAFVKMFKNKPDFDL